MRSLRSMRKQQHKKLMFDLVADFAEHLAPPPELERVRCSIMTESSGVIYTRQLLWHLPLEK